MSPQELLRRLGLETPLFAADEGGIFAAINDKERGILFAVGRGSGNFRWRIENIEGWILAPPLIWKNLYIAGTSTAKMNWQEEDGAFASVDWGRGGAVYAFEAEDGSVHFWDSRVGTVRQTPRVEGEILIVTGELRTGGFRDGAPWSRSCEVESHFRLRDGVRTLRRVRGDVPPGYFAGEPRPEPWG